MSTEKLNIPVDLDLSAAIASLNRLKGSINASVANASRFQDTFAKTQRLTEAVARATKTGATHIAMASGELISANELQAQLLAATQELQAVYEKQQASLQSGAATLNIQLISLREMNRQATANNDALRITERTTAAVKANLEQAASVTVRPPDPPRSTGGTTSPQPKLSGGALIRVATVAASVAAFGKVKTAVQGVTNAVGVGIGKLDQFNLARMAGKADPALNLMRRLFTNFGATVAAAIDYVRTRIDAMVTHWRQSATAGVGAVGQIAAAIQRLFLTIVKHVQSISERMQASANAQGSWIPGLQKATQVQEAVLRKLWSVVDSTIAKLEARLANSPLAGLFGKLNAAMQSADGSGLGRTAAVASGAAIQMAAAVERVGRFEAAMAGAAGVLTGRMQQTSGVVGTYASAVAAAAAPARVLNRTLEVEATLVRGLTASLAFVRRGYTAITTPIAEFRHRNQELNRMLANAPTAYRRWALAIDYAKFGFTALKTVVMAVFWPVKKLLDLLLAMLAPLRSLSRLTGAFSSAARGLFGFGRAAGSAAGRAADLTASAGYLSSSLLNVAASGRTAQRSTTNIFMGGARGLKSMVTGLLTSKLALGAMVAAALTWGATTAIATETATVKFGTLLQDMGQGKALIKEITNFSAKTPFSNEELRESAGLLLAAKVPADQITQRLQMLGDIAAGTSKPLGEFAPIFQKVASTGKFGLDQINQFAERGVPIYDALQQTMGVSRTELLSMVSSGKLGFAEMDAALKSLTTGTGLFAGGMERQSQTMAGLWSTLKDNVAIALEGIVVTMMPLAKRMVNFGITIVQAIGQGIAAVQPVLSGFFQATEAIFKAVFRGITAALTGIWTVASKVFGLASNSGSSMFSSLIEGAVIFFAAGKYAFDSFGLTWDLIATNVSLSAVSMFEDIVYWLAVKIPAYLTWFGANWKNLFVDIGHLTATILTNLFTNIRAIMTAVWDWIQSAGMSSFEVTWVPLTDGFKSTVEKLPDIPPRAMSELEKGLSAEAAKLGEGFSAGLGDAVNDALKTLTPEIDVKLKSTPAAGSSTIEDGTAGDTKSGARSNVAQSLNRDSVESLKAIFEAKSDRIAAQQLSEQKKQTKAAQSAEGYLKQLAGRAAPEPLGAF